MYNHILSKVKTKHRFESLYIALRTTHAYTIHFGLLSIYSIQTKPYCQMESSQQFTRALQLSMIESRGSAFPGPCTRRRARARAYDGQLYSQAGRPAPPHQAITAAGGAHTASPHRVAHRSNQSPAPPLTAHSRSSSPPPWPLELGPTLACLSSPRPRGCVSVELPLPQFLEFLYFEKKEKEKTPQPRRRGPSPPASVSSGGDPAPALARPVDPARLASR